MKLYEYMDVEYYNKTMQMSAKRAQDQFDLKSQAETLVAQKFIVWQRNWYKLVAHFTLLGGFIKSTLTGNYPTKVETKKPDNLAPESKPALSVVKESSAPPPSH